MSNQVKPRIIEAINNNCGIMLKDQEITDELKSDKLSELIKFYGSKKINLNLMDLLSPSISSRAKDQPRPQNPFILFRRNYSKGLKIANTFIGTGYASKLAGKQWKLLSEGEKEFWRKLSSIAKEMHRQSFPGYKFNPVKSQENAIEKKEKLLSDTIESTKSLSNGSTQDFENLNLSSNYFDSNVDPHPITELIDNFYDPMDIEYNTQEFYFQPTDPILYQNEIPYDANIFDQFVDPALFNL
ncbi:MAG TPA: HMG-box domain-containing protein [Nitrososphaeraceae archaeon]|nr:HMG-box domain-containing protein [Nitrososphaeraceae archaeon]